MKNIREMCNGIADNLGILHPTCDLLDANSLWYNILYDTLNTLNKEFKDELDTSETIVWDNDTLESKPFLEKGTDYPAFDEYLCILCGTYFYLKHTEQTYAKAWAKYNNELKKRKGPKKLYLQENHLYKCGTRLYYVSEWTSGNEKELDVEVFEQCKKPNENIYEDALFDDDAQIKSVEEFEKYIEDRKLVDLGLLKNTAYEFKEVPGCGRCTTKVLVYTYSYDKDDLWSVKLERERMIDVLNLCKPLIVEKMQRVNQSDTFEYNYLSNILKEIDKWKK